MRRQRYIHTEYMSPPLTTVRQPFRGLGVRASCGCRYAEHNPPNPEDRLVLS